MVGITSFDAIHQLIADSWTLSLNSLIVLFGPITVVWCFSIPFSLIAISIMNNIFIGLLNDAEENFDVQQDQMEPPSWLDDCLDSG